MYAYNQCANMYEFFYVNRIQNRDVGKGMHPFIDSTPQFFVWNFFSLVFSTSHVIYLNTHSAIGHNIAKNRNKLFDANTMCIKS